MISIGYILSLLDSNNPAIIKSKGLELARKVECISIFFCPKGKKFNKNVWENCAKIISEKSDEDLERYLYNMFLWILTSDAPGSDMVFERLVKGKWASFEHYYKRFLNFSRKTNNTKNENRLLSLYEEKNKYKTQYIYIEKRNVTPVKGKTSEFINNGNGEELVDIDYIMWLLSYGRNKKIQKKGIRLARNIECLNAFIWPYIKDDVFSSWGNCAKLITEKSDEELLPYFWELMKHLDNMMLPGALDIYDRLLKCENIDNQLEDFEKYPLFDENDGHYEEVIEKLRLKQSFL